MAVQSTLEVERNGSRRVYNVWYADDPPKRQEAVGSFGSCGDLFPAMDLPPVVYDLPLPEANQYLRDHPVPKLWSLLTLTRPIIDEDLARLRYLPELRTLKLHCNVSDAGVKHVLHLKSLETLLIYSASVTDACLETVSKMTSLRYLDMQRSRSVSPAAFEVVIRHLPKLRQSWPPRPAA